MPQPAQQMGAAGPEAGGGFALGSAAADRTVKKYRRPTKK
jgi:hypothetical protein